MSNSSTKSAPLFTASKYVAKESGPIVIAYRLKSPENMGHIIRLASNFGCSKVIFVGNKELVRESKIKKVGGAAMGQVEWLFCSENEWQSMVPIDYEIVAIETVEQSFNICKSRLPSKMAMMIGNEVQGLANDVVSQCSATYHIPMVGKIKSMNVSHACCVALYEWVSQNVAVD